MGTAGLKNEDTSPQFSRTVEGAPDAPRRRALYRPSGPISGQPDSRAVAPDGSKRSLRRKENSSRGPRRRLGVRSRRRAHPRGWYPWPGSGISTRFPFGTGREPISGAGDTPRPRPALCRSYPVPQGRLTHAQLLFAWNPSLLRPSKFSFEYSLLPPRSALGATSPGLTPRGCLVTPTPSYSLRPKPAPQRPGMSGALERHPFSGPIHSAGELLHTP